MFSPFFSVKIVLKFIEVRVLWNGSTIWNTSISDAYNVASANLPYYFLLFHDALCSILFRQLLFQRCREINTVLNFCSFSHVNFLKFVLITKLYTFLCSCK